jgi:hypothetical protein
MHYTNNRSRISCLNLTLLHEWCDPNRLSSAYFDTKLKKTPFIFFEVIAARSYIDDVLESHVVRLADNMGPELILQAG